MSKVLVVAYHFPPNSAVGGVRPSKFVRYLPEFGWEPIVLTLETDIAPETEAPSVRRVPEWPHPLKRYTEFRMQRARRKGAEDKLIAEITVPHTLASEPPARFLRDPKGWLLAFMWLPDQEVGWIIPAIWRGIRLIRNNKINHVLTTGPPFSCHLVGLVIKRLTGVKWVADFRDPWSVAAKPPSMRNPTADKIESRLIRAVMKHADVVLSVTENMTEQCLKEYHDLDPRKFLTLTNGFDPLEFKDIGRPAPSISGPIVFSYLGGFYFGRTPEPFLRALAALIEAGKICQEVIEVNFIGYVTMAEGQNVHEMISRYGLEGIVTLNPPIPRSEALRRSHEAHVLLILDECHPVQIPMKSYEAIASGAVILNIGSGGAVASLLARTGRGISVDYRNPHEIKTGILECIRRSRSEEWKRTPEPWADASIQPYNFRKLTGGLAEILKELEPANSVAR